MRSLLRFSLPKIPPPSAFENLVPLLGYLTRIFHAPEGFTGKTFKGAAVVNLLQALDNAANGPLRERPPGEIFFTFQSKRTGYGLYPDYYNEIFN